MNYKNRSMAKSKSGFFFSQISSNIYHYVKNTEKCRQKILTGGNFEERWCEPSPNVRNSLWEIIGECLLLKGWQTVCDDMPDPGQISKVAAHVDLNANQRGRRTAKETRLEFEDVISMWTQGQTESILGLKRSSFKPWSYYTNLNII